MRVLSKVDVAAFMTWLLAIVLFELWTALRISVQNTVIVSYFLLMIWFTYRNFRAKGRVNGTLSAFGAVSFLGIFLTSRPVKGETIEEALVFTLALTMLSSFDVQFPPWSLICGAVLCVVALLRMAGIVEYTTLILVLAATPYLIYYIANFSKQTRPS